MKSPAEPIGRHDEVDTVPKPRVTLGLPVYNGERYVGQAIDTILAQTYTDFVLLIGDNCSTDRTEEICRRYAEADARIVYHRHPQNIGAGPNFNYLFDISDGEYFKWCPHDDLMAPEYLDRCVAQLDANPDAVLCHTDTLLIDASGDIFAQGSALPRGPASRAPAERFCGFVMRSRLCYEVLGVIRASALRRTQLHQPYFGSDRALLAALMLQGRFLGVAEPLFMNRRHAEAFSESAVRGVRVSTQWYDPRLVARRPPIVSRLYRDYWRLACEADIPLGQKLACCGALLLWPFKPRNVIEFVREGMQYLPDPVAENLRRGKHLLFGR